MFSVAAGFADFASFTSQTSAVPQPSSPEAHKPGNVRLVCITKYEIVVINSSNKTS
jgi:hypothetical protein